MKRIDNLKNVEIWSLTPARDKAICWFFAYPHSELSLTDLAKKLKISKTNANRVILELVEKGFLKLQVLGKIWRISCNLKHKYNINRKIAHNFFQVTESNIIEYITQSIPSFSNIILFGSYRKGDDDENSDIDIAVEVLDKKNLEIIELGIIKKLGYRKDIKVNIHLFNRKNIDLNLFSNIANGIVLDGFLEVRP